MADKEVMVGWMYRLGRKTRNIGRPFAVVCKHFEYQEEDIKWDHREV